jgi:hypothetical protein
MSKNKINVGDIVKISNYDENVDNNILDYSHLKGGVFEVTKVTKTDFSGKVNGCNYGLFLGEVDGVTYFKLEELQLVCKKENRLDLL